MKALNFNGDILVRGFWIYIWEIVSNSEKYYYVGRTGDNSSSNAGSPISRMSLHFDLRSSATANQVIRKLQDKQIVPQQCSYFLYTYGPFYPETKKDWNEHTILRNEIALIEAQVAEYLKENGKTVLGNHPKLGEYNIDIFSKIKKDLQSDGVLSKR